MKITGYRLRSAIKQWETRKATAEQVFDDKKYYFPKDERPDLPAIASDLTNAERNVCRLQEVQARYNLSIDVEVLGERMTLSQAVKRLGGAGRVEKMWRDLLGGSNKKGRRLYGFSETPPRVRKEDEEHAIRALSDPEIQASAEQAARFASALREAIAVANSRELEIDVDEALLA